jgi:hypothetical protein
MKQRDSPPSRCDRFPAIRSREFVSTSKEALAGHGYIHCRIGKAASDTLDEEIAGRRWRETLDWIEQPRRR